MFRAKLEKSYFETVGSPPDAVTRRRTVLLEVTSDEDFDADALARQVSARVIAPAAKLADSKDKPSGKKAKDAPAAGDQAGEGDEPVAPSEGAELTGQALGIPAGEVQEDLDAAPVSKDKGAPAPTKGGK